MAIKFSIRILDSNGDGVFNADVTIEEDSPILPQPYHSRTDSDGWAEFEIEKDSSHQIREVIVSRGFFEIGRVDCDLEMDDGDTASVSLDKPQTTIP